MLGKSNPRVRQIRLLRRDRAERLRRSLFLAEGLHLCREALDSGADIRQVVYSQGLSRTAEGARLLQDLERSGADLNETSSRIMDTLQDARSPQPVLALVRMETHRFPDLLEGGAGVPLVVVAHEVQDPGNLGAILRTVEAAGGTGLVATGRAADLHHPRTVRATMGSIFRLPVLHRPSLEEVVRLLREHGLHLVAASATATCAPDQVDWRRPAALFLGPERGSLPGSLFEGSDTRVGIPMEPEVDSLSVGAAAAVILFAARQVRSRDRRRSRASTDG